MNHVRIGELVLSVARLGPPKDGPCFTYVDLSSVDAESKVIAAPADIPTAEAPSRARQNLRAGDVLVSTVRPNLNGVAWVPERLDGAIGSTGFAVLRADPEHLDARYLFHWVRTRQFIESMTRLATGASYPAITDAIVKSSEIPLSPLPEQRRIAAILDEADAIHAAAGRVAVLDSELSDTIFETAALRAENRAELRDVVDLITGPFGSAIHKSDYVQGGVSLINPSHIRSGQLCPDEKVAVSEQAAHALSSFALRAGDVVLGRRGEMGRAAIVEETDIPALCGTGTMILRPRAHGSGRFLARLLRTPQYVQELTRVASGVTMLNLSQTAVGSIRVPLPSSELVDQIEQVEGAFARRRAESEIRLLYMDALFASLQHRAFRGEL